MTPTLRGRWQTRLFLLDTPADGPLETGAAHGDAPESRFVAQLPAAVLKPQECPDDVGPRRAERFEFVHQAGEVRVDRAVAAGQQSMCMGSLRDTLAHIRCVGQHVTLDDRHAVEVTAEGPRSQQSAHAAAEDQR